MKTQTRLDSREEIGRRVKLTRMALGLSQAEMCRRVGANASAWNNAETGDSRISITMAIGLCQMSGVSLDWIYQGHRQHLPGYLASKISDLEAPVEAPKARSNSNR
jgi:transcriptional regulator with XRE-family HTH domain